MQAPNQAVPRETHEFMSKKRWIIATGTGIWVLALLGYLTVMPNSGSLVIGSVNGLEVMGQAASRGGPARFMSDGSVLLATELKLIRLRRHCAWLSCV